MPGKHFHDIVSEFNVVSHFQCDAALDVTDVQASRKYLIDLEKYGQISFKSGKYYNI